MEPRTPPTPGAWRHRALAVAWVALLWLPVVQMVFRPVPEGPATVENRKKAQVPDFRIRSSEALTAFTAAFEKYFGDTFGFRNALIRSHAQLHLRALRISPLATILIGRDGWLYYNAADGMNLADWCGLAPFSSAELDTIERNLVSTRDELRRRGIAFAVLVAPNKHTIYPEYLPESIRALAGTTRLDQLAGRLGGRTDILFVDPREALLAGKAERPLYFRTDTHWNNYGAHLAGRELTAALARAGVPVAPPDDEDLVLEVQVRPQTDLTNMLGLPGAASEYDVHLHDRKGSEVTVTELPLGRGQSPGRETRTCQSADTGPGFLLVQDSFGPALASALCREFARGVSIWDTRLVEQHLGPVRPDVVIHEVVERYLDVLRAPPGFPRREAPPN